ncbi:5-formyltetrahydrofolate cyclo-ligase [Anaeramoeba flamelloides]|uniref:5-formyltetrahydrofolate cyclo-ligase n=1 Tax=Anaeramoeba flamelloides TaxID=1746091 RepID=A0AAV8A4W3_9EUKA|nr:5-formyltetrahydrofolate cyclo-ligase [Anaeramoeba flamelloides]KAJ6230642.1 5-formyltetrahydrofolate cyclo-ligase [Anaeramoeba flamelloides]
MSNNNLSIRKQKILLRKQVRKKLSQLSNEKIAQESITIQQKLLSTTEYQNSRNISLYVHSLPLKEVHTDLIFKDIFGSTNRDKKVYIPYTTNFELGEMKMIRVYDFEDMKTLNKSAFSTLEPNLMYKEKLREDGEEQGLDLVIVPLLACDQNCKRLGRGKGFYDRFLSRASQNNKLKMIGIALSDQIVEHVPINENDWVLDKIISSNQIFKK